MLALKKVMKIVHTYINNMYLDTHNFAEKWGLVSLVKLGHEVTLLCGGETGRKEYAWKGINVIELPVLWGINNTSRILKGFITELKVIDADIFHTHHYGSLIPEITAIIGKIRKIPTFITFHNTFIEGDFLRRLLGLFYLICMQPFLPLYQKGFFISNYVKNMWRFRLIRDRKTIYNHINPPPKMDLEKKKNSLLFIGRLTHQKGIDILLKAIKIVSKEIPEITLQIIGDGTSKYKKHLSNLIIKYGLTSNVNFLGKLFGLDKWKQFYSSQSLIVPSRDEAFGNVVIEGMLCNLPVIVSDGGALPETSGGKGLIFKGMSPPDLARKIVAVLKNIKSKNEMIHEAASYASQFTEETIGLELQKEYKKGITSPS